MGTLSREPHRNPHAVGPAGQVVVQKLEPTPNARPRRGGTVGEDLEHPVCGHFAAVVVGHRLDHAENSICSRRGNSSLCSVLMM